MSTQTPLTDETWAAAKDKHLPLAGTPAKAQHWFHVAEAMRDIAQRLEIERRGVIAADLIAITQERDQATADLTQSRADVARVTRERDEMMSENLVLRTRLGQSTDVEPGPTAIEAAKTLESLRDNPEWNEWVNRMYSEPRFNAPHRMSHLRALEMASLLFADNAALAAESHRLAALVAEAGKALERRPIYVPFNPEINKWDVIAEVTQENDRTALDAGWEWRRVSIVPFAKTGTEEVRWVPPPEQTDSYGNPVAGG